MLHAKVQDHRTCDSGEEDLQRCLQYMGMAANLYVHVYRRIRVIYAKSDHVCQRRMYSSGNMYVL